MCADPELPLVRVNHAEGALDWTFILELPHDNDEPMEVAKLTVWEQDIRFW